MHRIGSLVFVAAILALSMPSATADGASEGEPLGPMNERGQYRYLVEFAEPGLLQSPGRIRGRRFEPRSAEAVAQRAQLMAQQAEHLRNITSALGHTPEVSHYFLATRSAMAIWLTPREAGNLRALEGVASIERERVHRLMTYSGPWFIGAETVWTGAGVPGGTANRGEDAVVAIIDSGVDPDHPSFANDPSCGHGVDGGPDKLLSHVDCSLTDISGVCIGLLPFDTSGHGSHVASTAAGNHLPPTTDPPPQPFGEPVEISGVAPCARIRSYKACPDLLCPAVMTEAAMNNIIMDGDVDVMNFSISGGSSPWTDGDRHKLELVDAGVLVAAAAGNTLLPGDPTAGAVNHRGPWVLTVAASTHDGGGVGLPALSASGPGTPPPDTQFIPLTKGTVIGVGDVPDGVPFTGKPIRRAIDDPLQIDDHGCGPLPYTPGYYSGAVGMVLAGGGLVPVCAFQAQVDLAEAAGADMLIIRNNEPGSFSFSLLTEPAMPVYSISMAAGEALAEWIEQHPGATVSFDLVEGQGTGDVLAGFSLRGPTPSPLQNLTKPDLAAPGVSIYAASPGVSVGPITLPGNYEFLSGTSMASPHAAGAAALVRSAHPDWTVSEVRSALMMTAFTGGTREDENTPWDADDVGSGRVDLGKAALAGLVMDESYENYLAADPEEGGDVRTLNIAALRDMNCVDSCSWTRTVRNTVPENTAWSISGASFEGGFGVAVSPDTLAFTGDDGETAEFTVTVTPTTELLDAVAFGVVVLSEAEGKSPDLHLTVAIKGAGEPQPPENLVYEDRFEQE